ncbi:MAG TPA: TAXI family TRAP transporter solute-binding subunit [Lacunisphaera sp.]|nr:TAXI family TRAP transporter solute-binding subunit [Lacunisphaera sp.]
MNPPTARKRPAVVTALIETFGFSPGLASAVVLLFSVLMVLAAIWVVRSAPPRQLVLTSGPAGSSFARWAEAYQKALAEHGVTLTVKTSTGSLDNLEKLRSTTNRVDIGFVTGGITEGQNLAGLESLGSVAYQPLLVFYRNAAPEARLADFAGQRIAIGGPGSATRAIALRLLTANGITGAPSVFSDLDSAAATAALLDGKLDAVFLMGDSASTQTLRELVRNPDIHLLHFRQADAYVRRYPFLNKIFLPEGSFDLGKDLPATDVELVGPTVELVARDDLNPALSDLLLEVAQEVHGKAGILQKRGEFPAPLEHEFPLSADAVRYYKAGKGFAYRVIDNFWIANLVNRLLLAIVPLALVLLPVLRLLPVAYQLGVRLRIYRCYRPLLRIERDLFGKVTPERVQELNQRLDEVEQLVNQLRIPASFADQFYELKVHITFVRQRLEAAGKG